jgi:hypothetical protein
VKGVVAVQPTPDGGQIITVETFEKVCAKIASAARISSFKVAENESPRPVDRVFYYFNYYDSLNDSVNARLGNGLQNLDLARHTLGFEKTFWDGWASIGLRVPLYTLTSTSDTPELNLDESDIGDLTVVLKVASYLDQSGNVISGGMLVTAPTSPRENNPFDSTVLQPWVGGVWFAHERLYMHGFFSVAVPTDSDDVTLMFNDIGVGYYAYLEPDAPLLKAIVPTFEVHVNTPLNHRGAFDMTDTAGTQDWVALTGGLWFQLGQNTSVSFGAATPVTGPKPFDFELMSSVNIRF